MATSSRNDTGLKVLIALLMLLALHRYYQGVLERVESAKQVVTAKPVPVTHHDWPVLDTADPTPRRVPDAPHRDLFGPGL